MPRLSNMVGDTGKVEIPVPGDEPLIVEYRRGVMTPRRQIKMLTMQRQLQSQDGKIAAGADALNGLCEMMADLVVSWNLTDDDRQPIPITTEAMLDVDLSILTAIVEEIGRGMSPDPLSGNGSSNGSTPRDGLEPLPITTGS